MSDKRNKKVRHKKPSPIQKREQPTKTSRTNQQASGFGEATKLSELPEHLSTRESRQQAILQMQERYGNQYVQRALAKRPNISQDAMLSAVVVQRSLKDKLNKAMKGWGTDEKAIFKAISSATAQEKKEVLDDSAMMKKLAGELNQKDMGKVLNGLNAPLAVRLKAAMKGWGTDEKAIFAAISAATKKEKEDLLNDKAMMKKLSGELSRKDMGRVLRDLDAPLALRLKAAMDGWGTDEKSIMTITSGASAEEKRAIALDTALMKRLESELSKKDVQKLYSNLDLLAVDDFTNTTDTGNAYKSRMLLFEDGLTITKDVKYIKKGTFGEGAYAALKTRIQSAVTSHLTDKFSIKIESPDGTKRAGDGTYPISVLVRENSSGDYPMNLHGGAHGRSGVNENEGNIYELGQATETIIPDITLAHECAHMILGASDEYANAKVEGRAVHTDNSLLGHFYNEGVDKAEVKARHFQFLVALVQKGFPDRTVSIVAKS